MPKDWAEQLVSDVGDLDNKCFNEMPLTIVITTDMADNGERYFDVSILKGLIPVFGTSLAEYINAESLSELFKELNKVWS